MQAGIITGMKRTKRTTLGERIQRRLKSLGKNATAVSRAVTGGEDLLRNVFKAERAGRAHALRGDTLFERARELQTTPEWLLHGEGDVTTDDNPLDVQQVVSTIARYRPTLPGASPIIDVHAGMGPGGFALPASVREDGRAYAGDAVRGEIVIPPFMLATLTAATSDRVHWLAVRGDSMHGTLEGGDWVGVDTNDQGIGQGGVFALRDPDGEMIVKRLHKVRGSDPAMVQIISDNSKEREDVVPAEHIAVIGRVVARMSRVG
jgi:phage repressor protein C with HTH and peptisase S24 domain